MVQDGLSTVTDFSMEDRLMAEETRFDNRRQKASRVKKKITKARQNEISSQDLKTTCAILVENAKDGITIVQDDSVKFANPAMGDILGYSVEELKQMKFMNIIASEEKPKPIQAYPSKFLNRRVPEYYQSKFKRKDGATCDVEVFSNLIQYRGRPAAMGVVRDITSRKQIEEMLRKENRKLKQHLERQLIEVKNIKAELKKEITDRKRAEKKLKQREKELNIQTRKLTEIDIALKVILKKREEDKTKLENSVLGNMNELVSPYLENLKHTVLNERQKRYLDILEANLNKITSPFLCKLTASYLNLTPQEIQVANLIRHGKLSKDIADLLNLSTRTIHFHRENIRKKFGINKRNINLRSYLIAFELR